ncbi:histidinol-phosphate aminotransferase [Pseudarthrobacter sp. PvP004]|uniref:histidinol-phosphate transaminase n=1 Tax=Pseudarthrobacter sp. PvP004 TaxID=2817850 RepID=UPI001AEB2B66|nr:histidinol-phosphate transaminase [Pseudarthrobacter sp. PvP004]MBP2267592.1 histidinol-phosphate aminotransferase [Pseudarthrobacter sp. PvP004]
MMRRNDLLNSLPPRESLRAREVYGAPQIDVPVALNTNENPHSLPPVVQQSISTEIAGILSDLNRYPDREFTSLREAMAAYLGHDLTHENIWAANGSNEVLHHILQAFGGPGRSLLTFVPSYPMYPILAGGVDTEFIAMNRGHDFSIDVDGAVAAVEHHQPAIVLLSSPNNPTGTSLEDGVVQAIYEAGEPSSTIVVVDEAYAEFSHTPEKTALRLLEGRQRLIVTRTMSKAFSLAGARVGYFAAAPQVADAMRLVRLPYHLSALTQAAAIAAFHNAAALLKDVNRIKEQRDRIVTELAGMGLSPVPSDANFVLFGGLQDRRECWTALLEHGVLVRELGPEGYLRVTAGTEKETTKFLEALRRYLINSRPLGV